MTEIPSPSNHLPALPEFEPSADLWSRIERRHGQRRRQRWMRRSGAAMAAAVLVAIGVVNWMPMTRLSDDVLAVQRREALQLEQDWQLLVRDDMANGYLQLRPVDYALQQAYDRHAERDELVQLWSERSRVLRELIRSRQGNNSPITI